MSDPADNVPNPNPAPAGEPPAAAPPAAAPAPAGDQKWWTGFADENIRGFAETRNWKSPEEAVKSFKNLETIVGSKADAIMVPGDSATPEEWGKFYDRAGRPGSAENYVIPEALKDDALLKSFTTVAHKAGLQGKQFSEIAAFIDQQQSALRTAQEADQVKQSETALAELRKENPGVKYDEFIEHGRRALNQFGLTPEDTSSIEKAAGTKAMMNLLAKIGQSQAEIPFVEGSRPAGGLTPEAARVQIAAFQKDVNWIKAWANGDADKVALMKKLQIATMPVAKA